MQAEGWRRQSALAVALSQLERHFLTGQTPWIPTRTYTQNIDTSKYFWYLVSNCSEEIGGTGSK
jgi:hypothetical protein